jgi:ribosomal protein S12 methylthiotransferase
MQDIKFDKLGAFPYSPEELTPSYKMKHQVPPEIAAERLDQIMFLQQEISAEIHDALIGHQMNVLIDEAASESLIGRSYRDAPEIDGIIEIPDGKADIGEFVTAEIIDSSEYDLFGKILD